jgi:dipeptidase
MCDTLVALPAHTLEKSMLFAKSADCEVNEANALVRIPAQKHLPGQAVRLTHRVIPQARQTYEVLLTKAFWTYGCEIGVNEHGLFMGEEAVFTTEMHEEQDGLIGPDLMRIGLERARTCREAIEVMTALLE